MKSSIDFSLKFEKSSSSKLTLTELEQLVFSHTEEESKGPVDEEKEKHHHRPDTHLLLWPELGFLTMHDLKYK